MKSIYLLSVAALLAAPFAVASPDTGNLTVSYWFDSEEIHHQITPGTFEIDAGRLPQGIHILHAMLQSDGIPTHITSGLFVRSLALDAGCEYTVNVIIDNKPCGSHKATADQTSTLSIDIDLNTVPVGFHTISVHVITPDGQLLGFEESHFMRVPTTTQLSGMKVYYLVDGTEAGSVSAPMAGDLFHINLPMDSISTGFHSLGIFMASADGLATSLAETMFIKIPLGGEGVKQMRYWLNDHSDEAVVKEYQTPINPMSWVELIEVPQLPVRSSCYTFDFDDSGRPMVYARNTMQMQFFDADGVPAHSSATFTDNRVGIPIVDMPVIADNARTEARAFENNEIKWYTFSGEMGDSVGIALNGAASFELYSPSARLTANAFGADAVAGRTLSLDESGTYYLAVHDPLSRDVAIDFVHIPRFAVLSSTPDHTAMGRTMMMTLQGNGYDRLKAARLTGNGEATDACMINVMDRYNANLIFPFDLTPLPVGSYSLELTFDDGGTPKTVIVNDALTIEREDNGGNEIEITWKRVTGNPFPFEVTVRNKGNVPQWGVPVSVGVTKITSFKHINFDNFVITASDETEEPIFWKDDNIFATGNQGLFIPLLVPYIGPGEEKTLRFSVNYDTAVDFDVLATCGEAWSQTLRRILADKGASLSEVAPNEKTNLLSLEHILASECETYENIEAICRELLASLTTFEGMTYEDFVKYGASNGATVADNSHIVIRKKDMNFIIGGTVNSASNVIYYIKKVIRNGGHGGAHTGGSKSVYPSGDSAKPSPHTTNINIFVAVDPNEITGYTSPGGTEHVGIDVRSLDYTIEFENDPEFATAAAHTIVVTDSLDTNVFDPSTFRMRAMKIGDLTMEWAPGDPMVRTFDLRPETDVIGQIHLDYDKDTGVARWTLSSLDPLTLEPTADFMQGILPVNHGGNGIGQLLFSVDLREDLDNNIEIDNSASIVFDFNDPIHTNVWSNRTDYIRPEISLMEVMTNDSITFNFNVESFDDGSGVWMYELYMRTPNHSDWTAVKTHIEEDIFSYTADGPINGAEFAVLAVDRAGNRQDDTSLRVLLGDADGNGTVDANDVVVIRNHYTGLPVLINLRNADVTSDGTIDAQDAISTRNIYLDQNTKPKRIRKK